MVVTGTCEGVVIMCQYATGSSEPPNPESGPALRPRLPVKVVESYLLFLYVGRESVMLQVLPLHNSSVVGLYGHGSLLITCMPHEQEIAGNGIRRYRVWTSVFFFYFLFFLFQSPISELHKYPLHPPPPKVEQTRPFECMMPLSV